MPEQVSSPSRIETVRRALAITEVGAFALLLFSYIWVWKGLFAWDRVLVVAFYVGIGVETHWRRGETARIIGFRLDNLAPFLRLAALCIAPVVAVCMGLGYAVGDWALPSPAAMWLPSLLWSVVWGTAQQYGLACVFYRRLREVLPSREAMLACGVIFSALHLPNPFLVGLTLVLGVLSCYLYERNPNVAGLGLAHGLTSFLLANSLPGWLTFDWMVGPQILSRVQGLF
ncbi:MAG: CPBP family intramembrane metalloprotease [Acidobacteriia bacterium]|nr:CPBP family intramembrane metalloprotease [Terriglobia bacterium]